MEYINGVGETKDKPVKKPLFWLTISRITRIGSAVLLILGGNVDLIIGFAIFALSGLGDPPTSEMKRKTMQLGQTIFMGGIILFGSHLTAGICWILKKRWAFWMGFILSISHCIGMFILLRYYGTDDPISEYLLIVIRGWAVTVFLYLATILINVISKNTMKQA